MTGQRLDIRAGEGGLIYSEFADDPVMATLVESFVSGLGAYMRAMEQAAARGQMGRLSDLAHQLKGAAGGYGFACIGRAASDVEQAAEDGGPALGPSLGHLVELCRLARAGRGGGP